MKKIKLKLNESLLTGMIDLNSDTTNTNVVEDLDRQAHPDYKILDVTVIPDDNYQPTIQSILIDLDEDNKLVESENKNLDINILSETVNSKTGYSNSLFEFESTNHTITLSLVLQETDRRGIYTVEAYTTRGEKIFNRNTCRPKQIIESYLNSLANEYLIDKPIKEATDNTEWINICKIFCKKIGAKLLFINDDNFGYETKDGQLVHMYADELRQYLDNNKLKEAEDPIVDDVKEDLAIEPGSDEEEKLNEIYEEPSEEDTYTFDEFNHAQKLYDEIRGLDIDYSDWNNLTDDERHELVKPKLQEFYDKHKVEFDDNEDIFDLVLDNLDDDNFHTEAMELIYMRNRDRGGQE